MFFIYTYIHTHIYMASAMLFAGVATTRRLASGRGRQAGVLQENREAVELLL